MSRHTAHQDLRALGRPAAALAVLICLFAASIEADTLHVEPATSHRDLGASPTFVSPTHRGGTVINSTWAESVLFTLELPGSIFAFGDTVHMVYRVTNHGEEAVTFYFANTCQKWFAVYPLDCGPIDVGCLSVWEPGWGCFGVETEFTLQPGESTEFTLDWRQHGNENFPADPGSYVAWGGVRIADFESTWVSVPFDIVPYGPRVVQEALDAAAPGDTVMLAPGVYFENLTLRGVHDGVSLLASTTPDETVIDGGGRGSVIYVHDVGAQTLIGGLTIRNGRNARGETVRTMGGGISLLFEAAPTISGSIIRDNECDRGGGLSVQYGAVALISKNLFLDNVADVAGGAIYAPSGFSSPPAVVGNTFVGNHAGWGGGAIYGGSDSFAEVFTVWNNIFYGNEADSLGGGILCDWGTAVDERCNAFWQNVPSDLVDCEDPVDPVFADPLFCDAEREDFTLRANSPCAGEVNLICGLIGAFDVACATISVDDLSSTVSAPIRIGPSPFSNAVEFHIPDGILRAGGELTLEIFDAAGRRLWRADVTAPLVTWDGRDHLGRDVATGTYFMRLVRQGVVVGTRRLVRVR